MNSKKVILSNSEESSFFKTIIIVLICIIVLTASCNTDTQPKETKYQPAANGQFSLKETNINFVNNVVEDETFNHLNWEAIYYGGGVAVGDINNDGFQDLYFTGNQIPDALYLNKGNFEFEDISKSSGIFLDDGSWSTGVNIIDVNNDGLQDIYVSKSWHSTTAQDADKRANKLYINNGDLTFTEKAAELGLDDKAHTTQTLFFDMDNDADLDVFILNSPSHKIAEKNVYKTQNKVPYEMSDKLFRNDNGSYIDISKQAGINDFSYGLGVVSSDFNNDGFVDLFIANDFAMPDRYFINQGNDAFKDEVQSNFKHLSYSSMGVDIGDINNDLKTDIIVLDMSYSDHVRSKTNMPSMDEKTFWQTVASGKHYQYMHNMLHLKTDGFYSEIAHLAGIAQTDWSWSPLLADFDNDGWKDLFVTNGVDRDIKNNDFLTELHGANSQNPKEVLKVAQKAPRTPIANYIYKNKGNLTF